MEPKKFPLNKSENNAPNLNNIVKFKTATLNAYKNK